MKIYNIHYADTPEEETQLRQKLATEQVENERAYTSINVIATKLG